MKSFRRFAWLPLVPACLLTVLVLSQVEFATGQPPAAPPEGRGAGPGEEPGRRGGPPEGPRGGGRRGGPGGRRGQIEPFRGVTTNGQVQAGLFNIKSTGVSTAPVKEAAEKFLAGLSEEQRTKTLFPIDSDEWLRWDNVHRAQRQGVSLQEMSEAQRELAFSLIQASLSAKGLKQTRDIMRLNYTVGEMVNNFTEYGEWLYYITIMGTPSATAPWGWQMDGHHCDINYFVLGDQVVMSPVFMGSEPVRAEGGRYAGTVIMQAEQDEGLKLVQALTDEQKSLAVVRGEKRPTESLSQAYNDNITLDYAGIPASKLNPAQRKQLLDVTGLYVGNMREGHAKVRMDEVEKHLDGTYFAWIGPVSNDAIFYYRIHSPVILIEFDHQGPVALRGGNTGPSRQHIHSVVRTPNGNDYGKDLLRQHYLTNPH